MEFINQEFFGNSVEQYLFVLLVFVVTVFALKIFESIIVTRLKKLLKKTETRLDDLIIDAVASIHWPFYVLASIYFSINFISVNAKIEKLFFSLFLIALFYYAIRLVEKIIDFAVDTLIKSKGDEDGAIMRLLGTVAKILVWAGAFLLVLSNLGVNVTSLIAGMGIGGIAIALALQNILGDLFSSLSIYFDKPFQVGDYVSLGGANSAGTVKKVGLKTTRIETPQGEELVVANSELTKAQLNNFGAMERRRTTFSIGVTYDTPLEKLKRIPDMIREIIDSHGDKTEVARIHFTTFGDFSLNYSITYYVNSKEYNVFADIQQDVNFRILEKFEAENIEMAFPTQTVHVKKDS